MELFKTFSFEEPCPALLVLHLAKSKSAAMHNRSLGIRILKRRSSVPRSRKTPTTEYFLWRLFWTLTRLLFLDLACPSLLSTKLRCKMWALRDFVFHMSGNHKFQGNYFGKSTRNVISVSCSHKITNTLRSKSWINLVINCQKKWEHGHLLGKCH